MELDSLEALVLDDEEAPLEKRKCMTMTGALSPAPCINAAAAHMKHNGLARVISPSSTIVLRASGLIRPTCAQSRRRKQANLSVICCRVVGQSDRYATVRITCEGSRLRGCQHVHDEVVMSMMLGRSR